MNIYLLKAIRDIRKKKARSFPIIIIIMVSGIATIMFANITFSFTNYLNIMWEGNHYHHVLITTQPSAPDELANLIKETEDKSGISPRYEIRSIFNGVTSFSDDLAENNISVRILAINTSRPLEVDQLIFFSGVSLNKTNFSHPMLVDKTHADKNHWKVGDSFKVVFENQITNFTIAGLVESPEYIDQPKITSEFLGNWINPVIYISLNDVNKPTNLKANQIAIYFDNPNIKNEFMEKLQLADQNKSILFVEGRNSYYEVFGNIFFSIWILSSIIFISTSIILVYMVLSFIIEEERQSLGVLTALGFNAREIVFSFILYSLILCLIGALSGSILGILIGMQIVSNLFTSDFRAIPSVSILSNNTLLVCLLFISLITITVVATSIFSCQKILSITPLESIRPNLTLQPGNKVLIEKLLDKIGFSLFH